ncbi:MAG: UDP-N-acetylmuramate--L-alanine ligase [Treponema sp.]|jgi:UDP-N-acetylmuramate--alanine ligase|nr:UDP-N-acetylmuramate--L-alanine ligase [Treponema sp.]
MDFKKLLVPGAEVYFIGIKGTGMCALAELMKGLGIRVSGSDRSEVFYTDAVLKELGIPYHESFEREHIGNPGLVVHSAAYNFETNVEMAEARRRGLPVLKYTDALGGYSALFDSSGIAGVHGKTSTTAICGMLVRGAGLSAQVLAGSAVGSFGGGCTLNMGDRFFIAETCEYRRHFLSFHPKRIVLTSVESDHQDYYPSYEAIRDAFLEYARLLPEGGELIYCADDPGAGEVAAMLEREGRGIRFIPYGFKSEGPFRVVSCQVKDERVRFSLASFPPSEAAAGAQSSPSVEFALKIPGRHNILNASAALALTDSLVRAETGTSLKAGGGWNRERIEKVRRALEEFSGSKRRQEILGEACGILFMDDYGHHPTAIKLTLAGLKEFYPARRLVVSFMPHTYSRTAFLIDEFASSFAATDMVFLHKIYASARESYSGGVNGRVLYEKTKAFLDGSCSGGTVHYTEEPLEAGGLLKTLLRPGDLFVTMGAGDNWKLGRMLFDYYREKEVAQ